MLTRHCSEKEKFLRLLFLKMLLMQTLKKSESCLENVAIRESVL